MMQKELGRYLLPGSRKKYKTVRHLKKYPPKVHVSRPCSNRACFKWACAEYHSVTICSKCAHNMPFICENINYQKPKMDADERGKLCKGHLGEKCSKVTKRICSNIDCSAFMCRDHTRLLCLRKTILINKSIDSLRPMTSAR